jgi:hypothetical protein
MARMNQNVLLVFCLRIADGIANGIWNLSVLSTYISVLEGSTPAGNAVSARLANSNCKAPCATTFDIAHPGQPFA